MREEFSELVSKRIEEKSISVKELSKETKISLSYLYELLNSNKRWTVDSIVKVGKCLGIAVKFEVV